MMDDDDGQRDRSTPMHGSSTSPDDGPTPDDRADSSTRGDAGSRPRLLSLAWWNSLDSWLKTLTKVVASLTLLVGGLAGLTAALGITPLGGGGESPTPSPSPTPTVPTSPPQDLYADFDLDIEVEPDQVDAGRWEPYFYWLPGDLRDLEDPPDRCNDRRRWAYENGGADADVVWARLVLENGTRSEVSIDDLRVDVVSNVPTGELGTVAACPLGGASAEPYGLIVDLTGSDPRLSFRESQGSTEQPVPRFELKPGEQDAFLIHATAPPGRLVTWRLVADVRHLGQSDSLVLPSTGALRLAGTAGLPNFTWTRGRWKPYDF